MIVVYTPEDGEPEHYDATTLRVSEAAIVQRTVDMKWQEIALGLEQDDLDAMRGIVWVIKKRSQPTLRFGDFDPIITELTTLMDNKEVAAWLDRAWAATEGDPGVTPEKFAEIVLKELPGISADPEYARALIAEKTAAPKEDVPEPSPPAVTAGPESPSPTSSTPETSTSGSSPTSSTSHPETLTT
ncbi:hypothetical protein [Streptomyces chartreusis]|uniref:hypothetical protein n=1 Tax=Streptomyces chartreusis TaxID=1969 RepID=UPI0033EF6CF2